MNDSSRDEHTPGAASSGVLEPSSAVGALCGKRINSAELFAGGREVLIDHAGTTYRLRHTSQGKLILTK
jgi:hemin uptake protein HemP